MLTETELLLRKLVNRCRIKGIYRLAAILYLMVKFVAMDGEDKIKIRQTKK